MGSRSSKIAFLVGTGGSYREAGKKVGGNTDCRGIKYGLTRGMVAVGANQYPNHIKGKNPVPSNATGLNLIKLNGCRGFGNRSSGMK